METIQVGCRDQASWFSQRLLQAVPEGGKGIKGVSRLLAWAVGLKGPVLHTTVGGKSWTSQKLPVSNVTLWKISFVGARRESFATRSSGKK
jgi:photosystem II stability/assembly factor-like uncharacterized protein